MTKGERHLYNSGYWAGIKEARTIFRNERKAARLIVNKDDFEYLLDMIDRCLTEKHSTPKATKEENVNEQERNEMIEQSGQASPTISERLNRLEKQMECAQQFLSVIEDFLYAMRGDE